MLNKLLIHPAILLALMGCNAPASTPSSVESTTPAAISNAQENNDHKKADKITQQVFELTNAERMKNNLPALKRNEKLDTAALNHALDMAKNEFLEHTGSDGSKVRDRVKKVAYAETNKGQPYYVQVFGKPATSN